MPVMVGTSFAHYRAMNILRLTFIVAPIFIASLSFAQECKSIFSNAKVSIDLQNKVLEKEFIKFIPSLESLAKAVNVDPVSVRIVGEGQWAAYDHRTASITSVAQYLKDGGYTNHPKYGRVILTHEYTHGILEAYLNSHSHAWSMANKNFDVVRKESTSAMDDFFVLLEKISFEKDPAKKEALELQKEEANQRILKSTTALKEAILERSLSKSYHEFSADLIPVLLFKDKRIIENSLRSKDLSEETHTEWRSFENNFGPAKIAVWKKVTEQSGKGMTGYDPYYFFAPARSFVGDSLSKRTFSEVEIHSKLPAIFHAVQKHYEDNVARREPGSELDLHRLNVTLAREISAVLEQ